MSRVRKGPFNPANSDGCTVLSKPYNLITGKHLKQRHCCIRHDEKYWYGGSCEQRLQADVELRDCVWECGDNRLERFVFKIVGWIMYFAVRIGGTPKFPFPWRWRNNVPFKLKDVLSGYKSDDVDLIKEKQKEADWLLDMAMKRKQEIENAQ